MPDLRPPLAALLLGALLTLPGTLARPAPPGYERTCTEGSPAVPTLGASLPLPAGVSGRVDFYAARLDAAGRPLQAVTLGNPDHLHPMASSYKPLVVRAVFGEVDAGRLSLAARLPTTAAVRSLGPDPADGQAGGSTLDHLLDVAINGSNNTAADLLLLTYGPERLARRVHDASPCTSVLLTTKAWWTAQVGRAPEVLGPETLAGAERYSRLPFEQRLEAAARLIAAVQRQRAPDLVVALDRYFQGRGPVAPTPLLDLDLQNTTTPRAYAALLAPTLSGDGLSPASRARLRAILATGCCRPDHPTLPVGAWLAKGGITGGVLNLTGLVELPGGTRLVYVYLNDLSGTLDAGTLRRSAPGAVLWIQRQLARLVPEKTAEQETK